MTSSSLRHYKETGRERTKYTSTQCHTDVLREHSTITGRVIVSDCVSSLMLNCRFSEKLSNRPTEWVYSFNLLKQF